MNKIIYAWEGLKKFMCKKSNINDCIESMNIIDELVDIDENVFIDVNRGKVNKVLRKHTSKSKNKD